MSVVRRVVVLTVLLVSCWVLTTRADSWAPPSTETYVSANGNSRAIIVPRALAGALRYFEDKVEGVEPAGQAKGAPARSPTARVELKQADGSWKLLWVRPLVNDVGPTSALVADDGSHLVTFDNWHSAGYGDDVVVIYDGRGQLVRKLSLDQVLPPAYVHHVPRSVSSRWWSRGDHRLVESDAFVELQVAEPGSSIADEGTPVPVRIRLADGAVLPATGPIWEAALAKAQAMEAHRMSEWEALRRLRATPLAAPTSRDTREWRRYLFEIRDRIEDDHDDARLGGMVLAAKGQEAGFHDADDIARVIADFDASDKYGFGGWVFASPDSERLSRILVKALRKQSAGSLTGLKVVFVGTAVDGGRVAQAAQPTGATLSLVDVSVSMAPGKPLPVIPPPLWMP